MNWRPLRYLAVGLTAYGAEMGSLAALKAAALSDLYAVAISFWVGLLVSFWLQKLFTFKENSLVPRRLGRELLGYGLLVAFNYLFTLGLVRLLAPSTSVYLARSVAIALITIWNYFAYKIIFTRRATEPAAAAKLIAWPPWLALGLLAALGGAAAFLDARANISSDGIINGLMFASLSGPGQLVFPAGHSFLLKWPLMAAQAALGLSFWSFQIWSAVLALATYLGWMALNWRLFGRLAAALSALALLSAVWLTRPYAPFTLLPTDIAMITVRNLEIVWFGIYLALLPKVGGPKRKSFWLAASFMALLAASDPWFGLLALGASGFWCLLWLAGKRFGGGRFLSAAPWHGLAASGLAAGLGYLLIKLIDATGLVRFFFAPPPALAASISDVAGNLVRAAKASLEVFGAPLTGRPINAETLPIMFNAVLAAAAVWLAFRLIGQVLKSKKPISDAEQTLVLMVLAAVSAYVWFAASAYNADNETRYFIFSLFSGSSLIGYWLSRRRGAGRYALIFTGLVAAVLIAGTPEAWAERQTWQQRAAEDQRYATTVANQLERHQITVLAGGYWSVFPIKLAAAQNGYQLTAVALENCRQRRADLINREWYRPSPNAVRSAALVERDFSGNYYRQECRDSNYPATFGPPDGVVELPPIAGRARAELWIYNRDVRPQIQTTPAWQSVF